MLLNVYVTCGLLDIVEFSHKNGVLRLNCKYWYQRS